MKRMFVVLALFSATASGQTVAMKVLNFPDNQYYSEAAFGGNPSSNTAIVAYGETWGADAYIGEGDNFNNTGNATDLTNISAWVLALKDTGKSWITPPGNHDYDNFQDGSGKVSDARTNTVWQTYIGTPMATQAAIVGNYPTGSNANSVLDMGVHGGFHWATIAMEFCPRSGTLTWANGIITSNPTWKFIITTHDYLTNNATLNDVGNGPYSCSQEGYTTDYNYGQGIWDNLVKLHDDQIRIVLCGHWNPTSNFSARRRDLGTHGYYVDQVYFDPQSYTNGGNGFVRLLTFYTDGTIGVQTYSPVTSSYMTDAANQFTLAAQSPTLVVSVPGLTVRGKRRSVIAGGTPGGWTARRAVTIDHTKIGSTDLTNYPVLISGTYTYLKTTGNGGNVTSSSGYDIEFCADTSCVTKLNWETESWSGTTGTVIYWVQVPTVSHTADTVIYLFYGNSSVTTDQSNKTGTWDSSFKLVVHLPNGTTLTANDSTSNANNGTGAGGSGPGPTTGLIDGAALKGTDNSTGLSFAAQPAISGMSGLTESVWFKTTTAAIQCISGNGQALLTKHDNATTGEWGICYGGTTATNTQVSGWVTNSTPTRVNITATIPSSGTWNDGVWHLLEETYDGSTITLYYDGASIGTTAQTGTINNTAVLPYMFRIASATSHNAITNIDEGRVSNTARSASWMLADYNSQFSPSTFYSVGAPF